MYKIGMICLALLAFGCAGNNNKEKQTSSAEEVVTDNHIYYLSIGNAHYTKDDAGKVTDFMNVKGANTSAEKVAELLSHYGKGMLVRSEHDRLLSNELLTKAVDSILSLAVKDSMSTTFIYYCGHGFCDVAGNLFMVPGNHRFNETAASLASLVPMTDIQKKILNATNKAYAADPLPATDPGVKEQNDLMNEQVRRFVHGGKPVNHQKILREVNKAVKQFHDRSIRPRFVIMADCCTEQINKANLSLQMNKDIKDKFAEATDKMKGGIPAVLAGVKAKFNQTAYDISMFSTQGQMYARGNRTIYTASVGELAPMIESPVNKEDLIGPVCRRMMLYLNKHDRFTMANLVTSLADERFDPSTVPPKFEDGNGGVMFAGGGFTNYRGKIGEEMYLDRRDSVEFVRRMK